MITKERAWNSITGKRVLIHGLNSDPFLPYQKYGMQLFVFLVLFVIIICSIKLLGMLWSEK